MTTLLRDNGAVTGTTVLALLDAGNNGLTTSGWHPQNREALIAALDHLKCDNWDPTGLGVDAEAVGARVSGEARVRSTNWGLASDTNEVFGQAIMDAVRALVLEPVATELPSEEIRSTFPGRPNDYHHGNYTNLEVWANNDVFDIKDGVDAQIDYLTDLKAGEDGSGKIVPGDSCRTDGVYKTFVGEAMKYKRGRLLAPGTVCEVVDQNGSGSPVGGLVTVVAPDWENRTGTSAADWGPIFAVLGVEPLEGGRAKRFHRGDLKPVDRPNVGTVEPVVAETSEVERLRVLLAESRQAHRADIAHIGEVLKQEAIDRSWCSEFDDIVNNKLNSELTVEIDATRTREYEVTWTDTYIVRIERSNVIEANDADDAMEQVQENHEPLDDTDICYQIRNDVDADLSDTDNWSASER